MDRVIVTVSRYEDSPARDVEVPSWVEACELGVALADALGWGTSGVGHALRVRHLGRTLSSSETLASAGVWDGAWLVLDRRDDPAIDGEDRDRTQDAVDPPPPPPGLVGGVEWRRSADSSASTTRASSEAAAPPGPRRPEDEIPRGYTWKKVEPK